MFHHLHAGWSPNGAFGAQKFLVLELFVKMLLQFAIVRGLIDIAQWAFHHSIDRSAVRSVGGITRWLLTIGRFVFYSFASVRFVVQKDTTNMSHAVALFPPSYRVRRRYINFRCFSASLFRALFLPVYNKKVIIKITRKQDQIDNKYL